MPAEGLPWLERAEILSFEEITRLVAVFAAMGVGDVRLTGGEPLVRRDFPDLAAMLARDRRTCASVSVTTNGFLLERDAEALVARRDRPLQRLGRLAAARPLLRADPARRAASGAARARDARRASPRRTRSRSTRSRSAASPRRRCCRSPSWPGSTPYEVRFIEFMPLDADHAWTPDQVLTGAEIRAAIERGLPARARAARAQRHRSRLPLRRRPRAGSASSTRSPSRSAPTATGSA